MAKTRRSPLKFKTREERKALCAAYCAHLSKGLSMGSFPDCAPEMMARYRARFPRDFDEEAIGRAEREGQQEWERAGINGVIGKYKSFNGMAWAFVMKNRFGWRDKVEHFGEGAQMPVRIEIVKPTAELFESLKAQQQAALERMQKNGANGGHPHPNFSPNNGGGNGTSDHTSS